MFNDIEEKEILPQNANVHLSKHVKILETNLYCRGCKTSPKKYIDKTPDDMLAKYLCACVDENNEATGPVFPLFKNKMVN